MRSRQAGTDSHWGKATALALFAQAIAARARKLPLQAHELADLAATEDCPGHSSHRPANLSFLPRAGRILPADATL